MPMTLVHRPRSAQRAQKDMHDEISNTYHALCSGVIMPRLNEDVSDWSDKPKFYCNVKVSRKQWQVWFGYDARTKGGKKYKWAGEGTAQRSGKPGKKPYKIKPKKGKALRYDVPHFPKTLPTTSGGRPKTNITYDNMETSEVIRQEVMHPGIFPRNFTQSLRDDLSERSRVGGFKSVTEAAVKRALRKRNVRIK